MLSEVAEVRLINSKSNYRNCLKSRAQHFHKSSMGIKLDFLGIGKQFFLFFILELYKKN